MTLLKASLKKNLCNIMQQAEISQVSDSSSWLNTKKKNNKTRQPVIAGSNVS